MPIDDPEDPESVYLSEADVAVLSGIVGHPYRMPTLPELLWSASDHGEELLKRRIATLRDRGLVEAVEFEDGAPAPDLPERFLATTVFGDEVLERRLSPERERRLQESYAALDKPDHIQRYERAPRPPRDTDQ